MLKSLVYITLILSLFSCTGEEQEPMGYFGEESPLDLSILPESPHEYRLTPERESIDRAPSQNPPNGLSAEEVPQFIIIGSDDNTCAQGMNWLLDLIEGQKNPAGNNNPATFDGTPLTLSLYWNSDNSGYTYDSAQIKALHRAVAMNCEVANHTAHHRHGAELSKEEWMQEMARVNKVLLEAGVIRPDTPMGFRTPFLEFNKYTFAAAAEMGALYDCSTVEGGSADQVSLEPGSYHWPYTMNHPIPGYPSSWWEGQLQKNTPDYALDGSEKTENLWQLPCYSFLAPHDSVLGEYGITESIRDYMKGVVSWDPQGKVTGLDYNLWAPGDHGGFEMNKEQSLATLKYTLDRKYAGNRAPLTLGMHSQFYFEEDKFANITNEEQREVLAEFIAYALTKEDVRIVSAIDFFTWYKDPRAL